jgi:preprotein translocase subunit SecG
MYVLVLILHILVSIVLMGVVLMQSGKGRGMAGTFGGGGNQTLFGGRGAVDFLGKATWFLGGAFMLTSLTLAVLTANQSNLGGGGKSLIPKASSSAPAFPPAESAPGGDGGTGTPPPATPGGK